MRVAIIHYHLRGGGVTRVIQRTLRLLGGRGIRAVVLTGEPPPSSLGWEGGFRVVPGLGYAEAGGLHPGELVAALRAAASETLGDAPDLWHIHNHALGKNPALPAAVSLLAVEGHRLLLQIHDFAEDGRPANYGVLLRAFGDVAPSRLGELFYPQADHVHYAVLNARDEAFLADAGANASRLHVLANPVDQPTPDFPGREVSGQGGRMLLYPVRGIRRKNLGELLLWAAVAPPGLRFAVTLAPTSPEARGPYERWVRVADELRLPVTFDAADDGRRPLADLLAEAWGVITTSVAEGFGMAFLEPWAAGRPLAGRSLPETTAGFTDRGIRLDSLYDRLEIPAGWVDAHELRRRINVGLRRSWAVYRRSATERDVDDAVAEAICDDRVEFGRLDEELQEKVIRRLAPEERLGKELRPRSPIESPTSRERIAANADAVRRHYGSAAFGRQLVHLYQGIASSPAGPVSGVSAERLLDRFLGPGRFRLLMT